MDINETLYTFIKCENCGLTLVVLYESHTSECRDCGKEYTITVPPRNVESDN